MLYSLSSVIVLSAVVLFKKLVVLLVEPLGGLLPVLPSLSVGVTVLSSLSMASGEQSELLWKECWTDSSSPGAAEAQLQHKPS